MALCAHTADTACVWRYAHTQGIGLTAVTAGVELFPTSRRALVSGFVSTLWWAVCIASLAPIAYLLRDHSWRTLQISLCASPCLVIFMIM